MGINNTALESLRDFAIANDKIAFARLCTAAIEGDERATTRLRDAVEGWTYINAIACEITRGQFQAIALGLIADACAGRA